ncbi:hypothetical protein L596_023768 [Steinernema carpocapsae]|uniref:Uncharacterized protein n=1 Tax=Steinernema carpocapsae TaxID=34508 RepID=A0A4U5MEP6_STECR|nr:hypothetical protein L596_023768 [Steinernema carpocapsae]
MSPASRTGGICAFFALLGVFFVLVASSFSQVVADPWVNPLEDSELFGIDDGLVVSHAFVQTGAELRLFSDVSQYEKAAQTSDESLKQDLQFEPEILDFGERFIGSPTIKKVQVRNPSSAESVTFLSISGSTNQFHCSFPKEKTLGAGESTTFDVVYLPRAERHVQITVYIQSSLGVHAFAVAGIGKPSPYRIRPFVAATIPCNGTFLSPITVHNPHAETLKITQIFSSGGDVHLEIPEGDMRTGGDADLWEIPPFATKTVMNAKLIGAHERNATSFVAIRALKPLDGVPNTADNPKEETILVPIEMRIVRKQGLFPTVDKLDFGLVKAGETSPTLTLEVVSTLDRSVHLDSIVVDDEDAVHNEIHIEWATQAPITVPSGAIQRPGAKVALAKIKFNSSYVMKHFGEESLTDEGSERAKVIKFRGKIVASGSGYNDQHNTTIIYEASVYLGELLHNPDDIAFHEQLQPPTTRGVSLTNHFPFGLAIYKVLMAPEGRDAFSVELTAPVVHIAPGETLPALLLRYKEKRNDTFATKCRIFTNVTQFNIPIIIFNGKARITFHSIDQTQFDFGLIDAGDQRSILFSVTNDNPVPLTIKALTNALPSITHFKLVGLESGNETIPTSLDTADDLSHLWSPGQDFAIPQNSFAVFNYTLVVPRDRSVYRATFTIATKFQTFEFPVRYQVEEGQVVVAPDTVAFQDSYPGMIQKQQIAVYNSFPRKLQVLRLSTLAGDRRFFFDSFDPNKPLVLKPNEKTNLGNVMFMPEAECADKCYVGMQVDDPDSTWSWFVYGLELPSNLAQIDTYLYRRLRTRYLELVESNRHLVNSTVVIDTNEAKHIHVPVQGELIWPRLLTRSVVHFPLTAVGNFTILNLTLHNPSTKPVIVQILPLVIYPGAEDLIQLLGEDLPSPLTDPVELNETLMFSLRDTELFPLKPDSPVPKLREHLEESIGKAVPKFTLAVMLQPKMKVRVRLGFLPVDYELRSSLLVIRNNLTGIEPVVLYGKGAHIEMRIDNRTARGKDPLLFEIQPHHLDDCSNPKRQMHKLTTTLTVKRLFMVVNTGEVPFTVVNMSINNAPCENRGFKIINCYPFRLLPNESYALEIAHTPDFLQTWNEANLQLYMHMNGTSWMFPMASSLPPSMLAKCHRALPRPPFEMLMYYSCVSALVFCLICIVACAYLEGDRTIDTMIRQQYAVPRKVFNLNAHGEDDYEEEEYEAYAVSSQAKPDSGKHKRKQVDEVAEKPVDFRPGRVAYDTNSTVIVRHFWEGVNLVLWLFSHIWMFTVHWRKRNESHLIESIRNEKKKRKRRRPVVGPKDTPATPTVSSVQATPPEPARRATKKMKAAKKNSDATMNSHSNGVLKQNGVDPDIKKVESIMDSPISPPKEPVPVPPPPHKGKAQKRDLNDSLLNNAENEGEFIQVKREEWLKLKALSAKNDQIPQPEPQTIEERPASRTSEASKKSRKTAPSNTDSSSQISSTSNSAITLNQRQKKSKKKRGQAAPSPPVTREPEPLRTPSEDEIPSEVSEEVPDWAEYQAELSDEDLDKDFSDLVAQTRLLENNLHEESTPTHQRRPRPVELTPLQIPPLIPPLLTEESIREGKKHLEDFQRFVTMQQAKVDPMQTLFKPENLWGDATDFGLNGNLDQFSIEPPKEFQPASTSAFDAFVAWPAPPPSAQQTASPIQPLETPSVETPQHSNSGAFGAIGTRPNNRGIFQNDVWRAPPREEDPNDDDESTWAEINDRIRDIWSSSPLLPEGENSKLNKK